MKKPPQELMGLRELRRRTAPGMCPFCDAPLKPRTFKPHGTCGDDICLMARRKYYKRDERADARATEQENIKRFNAGEDLSVPPATRTE